MKSFASMLLLAGMLSLLVGCAAGSPARGSDEELRRLRAENERLHAVVALQKAELKRLQIGKNRYLEWWEEEGRVAMAPVPTDKDELIAQNMRLRYWVEWWRHRSRDFGGRVEPRGAPGKVLEVRGNMVTISVGSDDGALAGDTYHIRRGASYIGHVVLTEVHKDRSVGEFGVEFRGPGAPPRPDDVAGPQGW
jgi:hypothetical protein